MIIILFTGHGWWGYAIIIIGSGIFLITIQFLSDVSLRYVLFNFILSKVVQASPSKTLHTLWYILPSFPIARFQSVSVRFKSFFRNSGSGSEMY